jgi:signal transduction histidine kinase
VRSSEPSPIRPRTTRRLRLLLEEEAGAGRVKYVRFVRRLGPIARSYWFDVLITLLAIVGLLELVVRRDAPDAPPSTLWFAVPAVAVLVLTLVARRRFPFAGPAAYWLLGAAISFVDWQLLPFMTSLFPVGMAVAFLLGNLRNVLKAGIGLAVVLGGAAIIVYKIPGHPTSELVFIPVEFAIGWLAGFALRERSEQAEAAEMRATLAERERDAAARIAVAEERARIARELHDIVAHAVSVMVLQVGAVRHKLPQALEEDRDALNRVEQAGRTALAEMRRLLGAMRRDGDGLDLAPQPGLDGLDSLLKDVGRAGLPVRLHVDGDPFSVPRAIDLSAYRIVQEGLTNALKHAHASQADVTVRYRPDELEVEVVDDGAGPERNDGLGHGLVGIRERVTIYGGEMNAGTAPTGGFVLNVRLPLDRYRL